MKIIHQFLTKVRRFDRNFKFLRGIRRGSSHFESRISFPPSYVLCCSRHTRHHTAQRLLVLKCCALPVLCVRCGSSLHDSLSRAAGARPYLRTGWLLLDAPATTPAQGTVKSIGYHHRFSLYRAQAGSWLRRPVAATTTTSYPWREDHRHRLLLLLPPIHMPSRIDGLMLAVVRDIGKGPYQQKLPTQQQQQQQQNTMKWGRVRAPEPPEVVSVSARAAV